MVPIQKTPDVIEDRARELLQRIGHTEAAADRARGLAIEFDYLQQILQQDQSATRWRSLRTGPPAIAFWYRESPRSLLAADALGRVDWDDPPIFETGMAGLRFDLRGRLQQLYRMPPQLEKGDAVAAWPPDWSALFADAGLDLQRFQAVPPRWTPPSFADARAAWDGVHPERPDMPLHVEAASYRGQPVYFQVLPPWARADRTLPFQLTRAQRAAEVVVIVVILGIVVTAALLARRHVRLGRGDKAGAQRLARYTTAMMLLVWALHADHVFDLNGELLLVVRGLGMALVLGTLMFTLYLALEPFVRRRWPQAMIAWTRVLAGRWGDPLVGRDILLGAATGMALAVMVGVAQRLPGWLGQAATLPHFTDLSSLLGPRDIATGLLAHQLDSVAAGLGFLLMLTLLRQLTRRTWAAVAIVMAILSVPEALVGIAPAAIAVLTNLVINGIAALVLVRCGLLACVVTLYVLNSVMMYPLTLDLTSWTATPTLWLAAAVTGLAVYGFRTALGAEAARPSLEPSLSG
jgi:eukaryotic-like serine/threonine-protein kinase